MCDVKLNGSSEFDMRPYLLPGVPDRSMTPTNETEGRDEMCEFSFDLDEFLNGIDMTSDTSAEKHPQDTNNTLEQYISELSDELPGEDRNSVSLCSSFVSSIEGEASSCFGGSYSALSFVEQCSQDIMGMDLNTVGMEMGNDETLSDPTSFLPLTSQRTDSHFSHTSSSHTPPVEGINIPQAAVSTLGRDITSTLQVKPLNPSVSQLKASLSRLECFQSRAYLQRGHFDFSTLSPDDVIRIGRDGAAH